MTAATSLTGSGAELVVALSRDLKFLIFVELCMLKYPSESRPNMPIITSEKNTETAKLGFETILSLKTMGVTVSKRNILSGANSIPLK